MGKNKDDCTVHRMDYTVKESFFLFWQKAAESG